jgi:hypothetical protein
MAGMLCWPCRCWSNHYDGCRPTIWICGEQNLRIAQNFTPLSAAEMKALRDRAKPYAGDGRFELYKTSIKFDNPEARLAHEFPIDMQQAEVKQMVYATQNSGRPFPQVNE